ncbi:MAG: type I restriction-modification system subunit M [Chitinophagaceae bacterium]
MASNPIINNLWAACNKMRQDPGTTGALQYIQQFSWLLFLKVYEETEKKRQTESELSAKKFVPNISADYTWSKWTSDKNLTGKDLIKFVNEDLFPYLKGLDGNKTQKTIAKILENSANLMQDGYLLKEAIEKIRDTNFFSDDESFAISEIYEGLFSKMKSSELKPLAEFYTPRPIGKFMTEMVNPEIGETIYDPANGPSGFLVESFYMLKKKAKSSKDIETLHEKSLYGKEVKPLPFVLGMMNLILNGVESPNIIKTNTLGINLFQLTERDRHNIVLTNPPFSGQLKGVSSNFPYPASATEILFLQHSMRSMKHRGKCAIIFPEGVLFTTNEQAYVNTKKELVENFNLHTIVKLPAGSFAPYTTIPTNILFFDKLGKTESIWFYEVQIPNGKKNFTKTNPIRYENFAECISLWKERPETEFSWTIPAEKVIEGNYNLDFKNPHRSEELEHLPPIELIEDVLKKENKIMSLMKEIKESIKSKSPVE